MKHEKYSHEELVLLKTREFGEIHTDEVQTLLYNCTYGYAGGVLLNLWKKGHLKRRKDKKRHGGKKYKYWLSEEGERIVDDILKKDNSISTY